MKIILVKMMKILPFQTDNTHQKNVKPGNVGGSEMVHMDVLNWVWNVHYGPLVYNCVLFDIFLIEHTNQTVLVLLVEYS